MASKKNDNSKGVHTPVTYWAIPRPWIIALMAVLIVTWFGIAAIWLRAVNHSSPEVENAAPAMETHTGKWGNIKQVPIVISPPMELVFTDWGLMRKPTWFFPGVNVGMVAQLLRSAGISADDAERVRAGSRPDSRIAGVVFEPDPAWVRALPAETRTRIYRLLARSVLNVDQTQAFRFRGENPEAWLGSALISSHTRQLVEPLIYRDGSYMLFSDIELIRAEIGSEDELRRLGKALSRQPTVIAQLSVNRPEDVDSLVEYWGRGGRRTEIRPLIESIAKGGADRSIDVIHLLPSFAQNHLYCYPKLSAADIDRPTVVNCLWTSLNFFSQHSDDRFLDAAVSIKTLKEDYFIVETDFELGDIFAFLDEKGDIFHAAVFIADDLVFSKNGISAMAPWTLTSIDDVKGYYRWRSENPRLIVHRRKNF
jgi:hypothetical protein